MEYVGKHVFVYSFDVETLRGLFVERFMRLYVETMDIALQRWSFELDMLS